MSEGEIFEGLCHTEGISCDFRLLYEDEESMSLVIKNVQSSDAGKYTFYAENELGSDTAEMNLTVKGETIHDSTPLSVTIIIHDLYT